MTSPRTPDVSAGFDESDVLITGEAVALDLRPAGFVIRGAGTAIDFLLYVGGGALLLAYVVLPAGIAVFGDDAAVVSALSIASVVLFLVVVPIVVELLSAGKSLGKLAVGARVVRDDGGAVGFRQVFIRALVGVMEIFATFGGLAAIVALLNGHSKRIGDLLAGTYSQYERASRVVEPVYGVPTELTLWSTTADVGRLPDRLAQRMTQFLRQARRLTPATRIRLSSQLAGEAARWVNPIPAVDPELFVAAVIAMRRQREFTGLMLEQERLDQLDAALTGLPHAFPERD